MLILLPYFAPVALARMRLSASDGERAVGPSAISMKILKSYALYMRP